MPQDRDDEGPSTTGVGGTGVPATTGAAGRTGAAGAAEGPAPTWTTGATGTAERSRQRAGDEPADGPERRPAGSPSEAAAGGTATRTAEGPTRGAAADLATKGPAPDAAHDAGHAACGSARGACAHRADGATDGGVGGTVRDAFTGAGTGAATGTAGVEPGLLAGLTVLHVAQPVDGGVARVVVDLVRAQVAQGARVVVACPPGGDLGPAAADAGAEVVAWAARRSPGPSLPGEVRAVARVIRAVRPDLLHLHSSKAGLAGRLAARGHVPTVFQPHAWSYDAVSGPTAWAVLRWERAATRWTHRVLCVSSAERDSGTRHGVRAAWTVVPNGVDTAHFSPPLRRASVRATLPALADLDADAPLVVCVGRLCPQKGQDVLLRAWPEVAARLPAARLVLVGDGPDRQRLLHDAPPGVLLAGAAADPLPWYQAADVVAQPSRWEGMALAPLEAMACARPVVAGDVSGARESLPAADTELCVVPPGEPAALAAALLRLLTDPATRTAAGLRALAHVRAHHDVRGAAAAVGALYTTLVPHSATRPAPRPAHEVPAR